MGELKAFPGNGDIDPTAMLEMAKSWGCDHIVIVGLTFDSDGVVTSVGSTQSDLHKALGYLECGKDEIHRLRSRKEPKD